MGGGTSTGGEVRPNIRLAQIEASKTATLAALAEYCNQLRGIQIKIENATEFLGNLHAEEDKLHYEQRIKDLQRERI